VANRICSIEDCVKIAHCRGWCPMHYQRWRLTGSLDKPHAKVRDLCQCGKPVLASGMCRSCYRADYYLRNKERENAQSQRYYVENVDAMRERARQYHVDHPEYRAARYLAVDKDALRARVRELSKDPARQARRRETGKAWRLKNYDAWTIRNRENTRRRQTNGEPVSYVAILARWGMVCHICTLGIESLADLHMDHLIPLSKGGPHTAANIRPSHALCNLRKGARLIA